ncbi:MAG: GTP cyclohydrolase, FolE2/MptA family [Desulfobulbus sp.]|jgi:GTP cyclohydrolase I
MKDIQGLHDSRQIGIRKVGVKTIFYPIIVLDKASKTQQTVARINMYVDLPHHFKGTHMSRFIEILNRFHRALNLKTVQVILEEMRTRLDAESAHLELAFPYFFQSTGPDQEQALARYDCRLHGALLHELDLVVEVDVPVVVSGPSGASGRWGQVSVAVRMRTFLWIEDLIALIEAGIGERPSPVDGSAESVCLRVSRALRDRGAFGWYKVVVKNTVNGYAACAVAEWPDNRDGEVM